MTQRSSRLRAVAVLTLLPVLLITIPAAAQTDDWRPWQGSTLAWQTLGGAGGLLAGGFAGGVVGAFTAKQDGDDGWADIAQVLVGMMIGSVLGIGVGVWGAGRLDGGNGGVGWSMLGSTAGVISGFYLGSALSDNGPGALSVMGALTMGIGGAMAGFHLSASATAPSPVSGLLRLDSEGRAWVGVPMPSPHVTLTGRSDGWKLNLIAGRF